jgi:CSLREA domain-containing protein
MVAPAAMQHEMTALSAVRWSGTLRALSAAMFALALLLVAPALAQSATITVDATADDTTAGDSSCTLREAIANANANSDTTGGDCTGGVADDEIQFIAGGTVLLTSGPLVNSGVLTIAGLGASSTSIDGGGASLLISTSADLTVDKLTLTNGLSAIAGTAGDVTVTNSTIKDNKESGVSNTAGNVTVVGSTVSGNAGTGVLATAGDVVVTNSTFSGNQAGAIANSGGDIRLVHSTVVFNAQTDGTAGGATVGLQTPGTSASLTVTGSIVAANTGGDCFSFGGSTIAAGVSSFDSDGSCELATQAPGMASFLGALQINAPGATATHALFSGNAAIDAVANCHGALGDAAIDQRGASRPDGAACDAGAFEGAVAPFAVAIERTADASVVRSWVWSVTKQASHDRVVLARNAGGSAAEHDSSLNRFAKKATIEYRVRVSSESVDISRRVDGVITVRVPNASAGPAEIVAVRRSSSTFASAVTCVHDLPVVLQPGQWLTCHYEFDLPDSVGVATTLTAVVSAQIPSATESIEDFVEDIDGARPLNLDRPRIRRELDRKARVYDSRVAFLGWVSASDPPRVLTYSVRVVPGGLAPLCGNGEVDSLAAVVGDDTETSATSSVVVPVRVRCFDSVGSGLEKGDDVSVDVKPPVAGVNGGDATDPKPHDGRADDELIDAKPGDPALSVNPKGRVDGIANATYPTLEVGVCRPGKKVRRGSKRDPSWRMIGPNTTRTEFFSSGRTYRQALLRKSRNRYYRLSNQLVRAQLSLLVGAPVNPTTMKALRWGKRYFASHVPTDTRASRELRPRTKRLFAKHTRALRKFNRISGGYHPPSCTT